MDWITVAFACFIAFKIFGLGVVTGMIWADKQNEKNLLDNSWNPFKN